MQQRGANILPAAPNPPPPPPGQKVKIQLFQNMVMLHIKFTHAATWKQIFYPQNPRPWGWCQNSFFSEYLHVAYKIKWNHVCSNMVANILLPTTLWVGSKFNIFRTISDYMESRMQHNRSKYFACRHPGSKGQNSTFSELSHIA